MAHAETLSDSEQEDLDQFCSSTLVEEISLKKWLKYQKKLDLQFLIRVAQADTNEALKIPIRLSRTIRTTTSSGRIENREKIELVVDLGLITCLNKSIVYRGYGDQLDDQIGDLIIIVRIRE